MRDTIRNAAGETLELKSYEPDMLHLINTYIQVDEPRKISPFDNIGLLDLIVKTGIATPGPRTAIDIHPDGTRCVIVQMNGKGFYPASRTLTLFGWPE